MQSERRFSDLTVVRKLVDTGNWGTKQNQTYDGKTSFIYKCDSATSLQTKINHLRLNDFEANYARRRWLNLRRHDAWMSLLSEVFNEQLIANPDPYDKSKDFDILHEGSTYPFDLKVTIWSNKAKDLSLKEYGVWLYKNQSNENRFHLRPRLFIVSDTEELLYNYSTAEITAKTLKKNFKTYLFDFSVDTNLKAMIINHPAAID